MAAKKHPWLLWGDQAICALVIATTGVLILFRAWQQQIQRHPLIEPQRAESAEFVVDINTAPWPELALLPGIGPTLAKRIVADREAHGDFRHVDELARVRGIGAMKLQAIRPHARCGDLHRSVASHSQSSARSSAGAE